MKSWMKPSVVIGMGTLNPGVPVKRFTRDATLSLVCVEAVMAAGMWGGGT